MMRNKLIIILMGIILIFGIFNVMLNYQKTSLTGFAVADDSVKSNDSNLSEESDLSEVDDLSVTEEQALAAIEGAKEIMLEMKEFGFAVLYVNDTIIEAERVLEQVRNAEILRDKSSSPNKRLAAQKILELIDWEEITYGDVVVITDEIKDRKSNAFIIVDSINVTEISLQGFEERGIDITEELNLIGSAKTAFNNERYEEAEEFLDKIRENIKLKNLAFSTFTAIRRGAQTFIEKYWRNYWYVFIVFFAVISVTAFFVQRGIKQVLWKRKILRLKRELIILTDLIKKAQEERFTTNKISNLTYNLRMKHYKDKRGKIKQILSMLEMKLKKLSVNQGYLRIDNPSDFKIPVKKLNKDKP
jgi:hypothetical protein